MKDWQKTLISNHLTVHDAIEALNKNASQILLVIDDDGRLLGTITDGDVRRALLSSFSLAEPATKIMNHKPSVAYLDYSDERILSLMRQKEIRHMPIVDQTGKVVGLKRIMDFFRQDKKENTVVIMAGGLGSRLGSLTRNTPKPLLKVGNKPILETILISFIQHGFEKFFFATNYLAEKVYEYFGDGSNWNAKIQYLKEEKKLGTAGALSLLPKNQEHPLIIMNGDILTKVDFQALLDFHLEQQAQATMCVREYEHQIPYGVIETNEHRISQIVEKPVHNYLVNAGIYVINPDVLPLIPEGTYFDMPQLFQTLIKQRMNTVVFPINEYWIDIGHMDDFDKAKGDYHEVFSK